MEYRDEKILGVALGIAAAVIIKGSTSIALPWFGMVIIGALVGYLAFFAVRYVLDLL